MNMQKQRLDYIDALRGIAALMVLVCHTLQIDARGLPTSTFNAIESFKYGVQLFFIISAVTIFYSLKNGDTSTRNFFIRRVFRIVPLYLLAVVAYSSLQGFSPAGAVINALFLHGFSPKYINSIVPAGWSVGVEMIFYCLVPFIFRYVSNLKAALHFLVISLLVGFACLYVYRKFLPSSPETESYIYFYLPNQLPVFALGIIGYFLLFEQRELKFSALTTPIMLLSGLIITSIVTHLAIFGEHFLFAVACVGIILVMSKRPFGALVNRPTLFFGKISYSLYLGQYVGIILLPKYGLTSPFHSTSQYVPYLNFVYNLVLLLSFTTILAFVLFHLVEQPFQDLGRRIIKRKRERFKRSDLQSITSSGELVLSPDQAI